MPNPIISILIMALMAYLPRVIPFFTVTKRISNLYVRSFLKYVPFAVLGALTFPNIFFSTDRSITALTGTGVALFLAYKEKKLMTVILAAIISVYIASFIF